jgi:tetratricopeptide (TPR) repeat protein
MGLLIGSKLHGRFRVLARLGEGGMGSVYQVEDLARPGTVWAMKELLDDASASPEDAAWAARHFDEEIALMRRLRHPRIPAFETSFVEDGRHYFVMEFIPGASLEDRLAHSGAPLPESDVLGWMHEICSVLSYLHSQQPPVIVRDLKPGNIMITPQGDARLIDFGIARTYKPGKTSNTENLGTMTYASPEHHGHAQTDARSDIYSLGATMYHLLTNREPSPMETPMPGALRRLQPAISEAAERIVIRAMQLDPARRFQSAAELADALAACRRVTGPQPATATRKQPAVVLPRGSGVAVAPARPAGDRAVATQPARICPRCGHANRPTARFCARDGTPLRSGMATAAPTTTPVLAEAIPSSLLARRGGPTNGTAELDERRATEAFAARRYVQTVRACESALSKGRATADVYLLHGRALRELGRLGEAAQAFAYAAELRPEPALLLEAGLAHRAAGHLDQAQLAFTKARQLDPRDPELAYQLGLSCLELGHLAQAEGELREALTLRPGHAPTRVALGRIAVARRDWEAATAEFRQATACEPPAAEAFLELGRLLLAQRHPAEALRALERAAILAPDASDIQLALGMCYHAVGRRQKAREALRRALALNPHDVEAQRLLKHI